MENVENKMELVESASEHHSKWKFFFLGVGAILVLLGIFGIVLSVKSVKNLSEAPMVLKVAEVLNLPVAKVNSMPIPYVQYVADLNVLRKFYSTLPEDQKAGVTDDDVSDQVLSRLVVNTIIKDLAKQFGIIVSDEEADKFKQELLSAYPSAEEAEAELRNRYGLDMDSYVEKVVKPFLLEQKLSESFTSGDTGDFGQEYQSEEQVKASHILFRLEEGDKEADVKKKAEEVLVRAKGGEDFAALAKEFGSDATADQGGDLGWFGKGTMVPDFEKAVYALEVGKVGEELVKTEFGFHIVKLDGRRQSRDFSAFFNDTLAKARIELLAKVHDPFADFRAAQENQQDDSDLQEIELQEGAIDEQE